MTDLRDLVDFSMTTDEESTKKVEGPFIIPIPSNPPYHEPTRRGRNFISDSMRDWTRMRDDDFTRAEYVRPFVMRLFNKDPTNEPNQLLTKDWVKMDTPKGCKDTLREWVINERLKTVLQSKRALRFLAFELDSTFGDRVPLQEESESVRRQVEESTMDWYRGAVTNLTEGQKLLMDFQNREVRNRKIKRKTVPKPLTQRVTPRPYTGLKFDKRGLFKVPKGYLFGNPPFDVYGGFV